MQTVFKRELIASVVFLFGQGITVLLDRQKSILSKEPKSYANFNLLHNLPSVFAVLRGWLFLGQRFDSKFLIGMSVAVCGALAIGIENLQTSPENLVGDA